MMYAFGQLDRNSHVSSWARSLFLIRTPTETYMSDGWHLRGYTKEYAGGVHIGNEAQTNFKLQLIM